VSNRFIYIWPTRVALLVVSHCSLFAGSVYAQADLRTLHVALPRPTTAEGSPARILENFVRDVMLIRMRAVDSALRPALPPGLRFNVHVTKCARPDYQYQPNSRRIVACLEMDGFVRGVVEASIGPERVKRMKNVARDLEAENAIEGFVLFGLLHEVGHAVIHQLRLPVLGNSEDAADGFAAFALLSSDERGTLFGAMQWLVWYEAQLIANSVDVSRDYADAHPFPGQRYERLRCLAEGRYGLTAERPESPNRPNCISEWERLSGSWRTFLSKP
jgi:hypothetical protein